MQINQLKHQNPLIESPFFPDLKKLMLSINLKYTSFTHFIQDTNNVLTNKKNNIRILLSVQNLSIRPNYPSLNWLFSFLEDSSIF